MKITLIILCFFNSFTLVGQIEIKSIGKVTYEIVPANHNLSVRNDSIAQLINNYIIEHSSKNFPKVFVFISDQNPKDKLSNFEEVLVYYQKYKGEFFDAYNDIFQKGISYIGIHLSLYDDFQAKAVKAIKYAVDNLKFLKKKEKYLSKKIKQNKLIDRDLQTFKIY